MMLLPSTLMAASAAVIFLLGALHLFYTFTGNKFHPRDAELRTRLEQVAPVISRQTTMWKVWVGCNASHSYGLLLSAPSMATWRFCTARSCFSPGSCSCWGCSFLSALQS